MKKVYVTNLTKAKDHFRYFENVLKPALKISEGKLSKGVIVKKEKWVEQEFYFLSIKYAKIFIKEVNKNTPDSIKVKSATACLMPDYYEESGERCWVRPNEEWRLAGAKKEIEKYSKQRPSPSESAALFPVGKKKKGNDGNWWIIVMSKSKIKRWQKAKI